MWTLPRPDFTAEEAFDACKSRIRDADLRARMDGIVDSIIVASADYDQRAENKSLHLIAPTVNVNGSVTVDEMVRLYTGRMVPQKSAGRAIYDAIIALAKHGRCPFCGHRVVSTLDHLLSKTRHPALAVTPNNLVPSCSDCNKSKLDAPILVAADQYLHPYFDVIEDDLWLKAEVVETAPASVRFFVDLPQGWSDLMSQRVANHFRRLRLGQLYSSQAAEELVNVRFQLAALFHRAGADGVRSFLEETHESRSNARVNSWQTAFYQALSDSAWYCEGGFD